jgi:hypothetical protein
MPPLPANRRSAESALSTAPPPEGFSARETELVRLMVFGSPEGQIICNADVPAHTPLSLEQACRFTGYRVRKGRRLASSEEFIRFRGQLLREMRESEGPRNLARAIAIRDDPGLGLAADRTEQLKAINVIEGNDGKSAVTVNVNQTTNSNIVAGYVIKLPMPAKLAPAIEHQGD